MLPYQMIAGGRFTLTTALIASGVNVACQSQNPPDFIELRSTTGWGEASDAQALEWWWERGMAQNSARGILQSSDATNPALTSRILPAAGGTSDAISCFDTTNPPTYASLVATTTNNTTFVVTMADTGSIHVGDIVRMLNVTGMLQISGYDFQVTAVSAGASITLGMQATAVSASANSFAANGTAASVLKFIPGKFYPRWRYIAGVTRAAQAVVYFTVANDFTPGEYVGLRIPSSFGANASAWSSVNNKQVRVLSVTNSATESSITLDLDTSGITAAFISPTSAATSTDGFSPSVVVPSSSGVIPFSGSATVPQQPPGTNLLDAFDNRNSRIIRFGAGLFNVSSFTSDNGDVWNWRAFKYDDYGTSVLS